MQYALDLLRHVLASYGDDESKLSNLDHIYTLFGISVDVSKQLYNLTHDKKYLYAAYEVCERSKATVLREELAAQNAAEYGDIPYNQRQLLNELRKRIQEKQKALEIGVDSEDRANVLLSLLNDKEQYASLHSKLLAQYAYSPLTYSKDILPPKQLQRMLPASSALLEYMIQDTIAYLFVITPDTIVLRDLLISSQALTEEVSILRRSINPNPDSLDIDKYAVVGHDLFQKLIVPAEDILKNIRQLYIIPDGILNILPFKALLTQEVAEPTEFQEFTPHFLIQRYEVSRGLSASLLFDPL